MNSGNRFTQGLNDRQAEAVLSQSPHLLILAGAGSGKTRVLAHRAARLIEEGIVRAQGLMALTFTNKAANNLKLRIEEMTRGEEESYGGSWAFPWVGTFHGIAYKLLRTHAQDARLDPKFQIMDADDSLRLIKRLLREQGMEEELEHAKAYQSAFGRFKDQGYRARDVQISKPKDAQYAELYRLYEEACDRFALVDFDELMLRSYELLGVASVLDLYHGRLSHVMIDEFQDTSVLQYRWLKRLCAEALPFTAVGDDDQSIYGWRGAQVENLQHLQRDFPDCELIRLEQNYRSHTGILNAANQVIQNNQGRLGKTLWTDKKDERLPALFSAYNEYEEADFVAETIESLVSEGVSLAEMAILYRSNAQSRVLENTLVRRKIPYRVFGGARFFERAEVKDALAYLRLIANQKDDPSFERACSAPPRGLGEASMGKLRAMANERGVSLFEATGAAVSEGLLSGRAKLGAAQLLSLITRYWDRLADPSLTFGDWTRELLEESGLKAHYLEDKDKLQARAENLEEFIRAAGEYGGYETPLETFLSDATLEAGENQGDLHRPSVSLMTLHASKGLEFEVVFLVGMEERTFPSARAVASMELEEERRLCYVGITRAMSRLYLSHCESRSRFGGAFEPMVPSRFLSELPPEGVNRLRKSRTERSGSDFNESREFPSKTQPSYIPASEPTATSVLGYTLGGKVSHPSFGEGVVLNIQGEGPHARLQIKFGAGVKWIIAGFAKLTPL